MSSHSEGLLRDFREETVPVSDAREIIWKAAGNLTFDKRATQVQRLRVSDVLGSIFRRLSVYEENAAGLHAPTSSGEASVNLGFLVEEFDAHKEDLQERHTGRNLPEDLQALISFDALLQDTYDIYSGYAIEGRING